MLSHASVPSSKPKVELDSHTNTCVVGDVHNDTRPVNVYSYDSKDGHISAKTVDDTVDY